MASNTALEDRFEVLKDIGDGSFGSVALARVRGTLNLSPFLYFQRKPLKARTNFVGQVLALMLLDEEQW